MDPQQILKLSDFKQRKSYVKIERYFKAKMTFNNQLWHIKTYIGSVEQISQTNV